MDAALREYNHKYRSGQERGQGAPHPRPLPAAPRGGEKKPCSLRGPPPFRKRCFTHVAEFEEASWW